MQPFRLPVRQALKDAIRLHVIAKDTGNRNVAQSTRMFIRKHWRQRNSGCMIELRPSL